MNTLVVHGTTTLSSSTNINSYLKCYLLSRKDLIKKLNHKVNKYHFRMFKYGIGEIVLFESDNEIVDHWLPALGAANITSVVGNLTDRTETNHKLATIIDLNVHGQVPIADSQPFFDAGQPIFLSDELELCFTNTKTSVKAPLKSSSTLKQLAGKSLGIKLDLCFQKSVSGRAIKVAGKQAFCGSVPIVFR